MTKVQTFGLQLSTDHEVYGEFYDWAKSEMDYEKSKVAVNHSFSSSGYNGSMPRNYQQALKDMGIDVVLIYQRAPEGTLSFKQYGEFSGPVGYMTDEDSELLEKLNKEYLKKSNPIGNIFYRNRKNIAIKEVKETVLNLLHSDVPANQIEHETGVNRSSISKLRKNDYQLEHTRWNTIEKLYNFARENGY